MEGNIATITMLAPLVLLLVGLIFTIYTDEYISQEHRGILLVVVALSVTLIAQNLIENWLAAGPPRPTLRTAASVYGYSIRPVFLVLFLHIVQPGRKHGVAWGLVVANWAVYMTAFFSHLCFWISEENHFSRGPLSYTCLFVSLALLADLLFQSLREYRATGRRALLMPSLVVVMILVGIWMDGKVGEAEQPVTFLTVAVVVSATFYYIWLHQQFVREHEDDLIAQQRIQIMLSQIRPHFLYNALGAIEELCDSDPKAAKAATVTFARYLRGNMASLSDAGTIPFERELAHTKLYLELEQLRFEDALRVRYEIGCSDFRLPTLTLEPLVENAVRHGVRGNPNGVGTVVIASRETPDHYEISVTDDGPGFDPDAPPTDSEREAHIGIRNARDRLERVCGGELKIQSAVGEGTTATILLPKKEG